MSAALVCATCSARSEAGAPLGPGAGATLDWIEAGLPQQNAAATAQATIEIQVTGTAARTITFGSGPAKASVTSDAPAFIRWVTQRASLADAGTEAPGDEQALALTRTLKVV